VPSVLRDTRTLLYGLGIRCSKYIFETHTKKSGRIAHSCKIHIKGKRNFIIFRDKIKFQSSKKQKIINDSIESFKKPKLGNNESLCMILKACLELHKDGREINKHTIAEKTTLNEKWIETRLKTATERKLMRVIGEGKPISRLGGRKPYIYEPLKSIEAFLEEYR